MGDNNEFFKEKVVNSFSNIKKDIEILAKRLENLENNVNIEKEDILMNKSQINELKELFEKLKGEKESVEKSFLQEIDPPDNTGQHRATPGNTGQRTTTDNNGQWRAMIRKNEDQSKKFESMDEYETHLKKIFNSLTDREFSIFAAIFELERQQGGEATYFEVSEQLKVSEGRIRTILKRLIDKGVPIEKTRPFHGKVSLYIKKEFHKLNLMQKLLRLRENNTDQRTLFDLD